MLLDPWKIVHMWAEYHLIHFISFLSVGYSGLYYVLFWAQIWSLLSLAEYQFDIILPQVK